MFQNTHMTKIKDLDQILKKLTGHRGEADLFCHVVKLSCSNENKLHCDSAYAKDYIKHFLKRYTGRKKHLAFSAFMKYTHFDIHYFQSTVFCSFSAFNSQILALKSSVDKYSVIQYLEWLWKKETDHKEKAELLGHIMRLKCS